MNLCRALRWRLRNAATNPITPHFNQSVSNLVVDGASLMLRAVRTRLHHPEVLNVFVQISANDSIPTIALLARLFSERSSGI